MISRRSLTLLAAVAVLGGLTACGDDDESSSDSTAASATTGDSVVTGGTGGTATSGGSDEAFCTPMEALANFNAEAPDIDPEAPFEELKEQFLGASDQIDELYTPAVDAAPDEIKSDLELLHQYTKDFFDQLAEAESSEDLGEAVMDTPSEVIEATGNVNTYIDEHCGFGLTSG